MEAVRPIPPEAENQEPLITQTPLERLQEMTDIIQNESDANFRKYEAFLRRIRKKEKISADEINQQKESWDMIKNMQKCRDALYKICYPKGQKFDMGSNNGGSQLEAVKKETSVVKDIVAVIPQNNQ